MENLLPIGSVVLLKEASKRIMIIGYYPMLVEDGREVTYDYTACIFPEGIMSSEETLVFNKDQIVQVFYSGLADEEQIDFMNRLKVVVAEDNAAAGNIPVSNN